MGKIPTQLAYNGNGDVIAWGAGCQAFPRIECLFKINFPKRNTIGTDQRNVEKLIADYLHHFCNYVLEEVVKEEKTPRDTIDAEWHLTTPGSWDQVTQRDFTVLASRVLLNLLPNCKIIVELNEALASCEFLIDKLKFPDDAWLITCDIGGATIDTALAITPKWGSVSNST